MECNEESDRTICDKVSGISASKGRTSEISQTSLTIANTKIKVGEYHHGLRYNTYPQSKGEHAIWVVIDCLMKLAHFIPFRVRQSTELLADKYIREVARLHVVLVSIMLDRDTRFRSHF